MTPRRVRLGVVTSGRDAPGMNACVRAVVKGAPEGTTVVGIRHGGLGLVRNAPASEGGPADYFELTATDVAGILHRSGTILKSEHEASFRHQVVDRPGDERPITVPDHRRDEELGPAIGERAAQAIAGNELDALLMVGGDTTCRAAGYIYRATDEQLPVVVVPASVDNDIEGTVETIGFDSAVAMAVLQVDALRETGAAMASVFVVEVMGREQGHLAVEVALATGAEAVLVPERPLDAVEAAALAERLAATVRCSESSVVRIVAEGARVAAPEGGDVEPGTPAATVFARHLARVGPEVAGQVTILGSTLRGAPPTAFTRNLATRSGLRAVTTLVSSARNPARRRPPTLLGMHHEGFLEHVEIRGDMVRNDRSRVLAVVSEQIDRLAR